MTNRIYPPRDQWDKFDPPLEDSEKGLINYLDEYLPEEWKIFPQLTLYHCRPDIIAFREDKGLVIYEVKDWNLNRYYWENGKIHLKKDGRELQDMENPVTQIDYYRKQLLSFIPYELYRIKGFPGEKIIKCVIYMHKCTTPEANDFFSNRRTKHTILGNDSLDLVHIEIFFQNKISGLSNYNWYRRFQVLKMPCHEANSNPIQLNDKQKKHSKPNPGYHRIKGTAGSGKTIVIAYRAAKLTSEGKKVLILTYNITLRSYIEELIKTTPYDFFWNFITILHIHKFCTTFLKSCGYSISRENNFEMVIDRINSVFQERNEFLKWEVRKCCYDAILIDEGQDFEKSWYECVCNFLSGEKELVIACDYYQNIYGIERWIDKPMKNFKGPWGLLQSVHRMPKTLAEVANKFSEEFKLDESVETEPQYQIELYDDDGNYKKKEKPRIVWDNDPDNNSFWKEKILHYLKKILNHSKNGEEIAILVHKNDPGKELVAFLENEGFDCSYTFEDEKERKNHPHKYDFWRKKKQIKVSTVHSFKGLESENVILFIPESEKEVKGDRDIYVYIGITRAKWNLVVLNPTIRKYNIFRKKIEKYLTPGDSP